VLEFRVLGPLEVVADGEPVVLRRQKPRTLLALLLLRQGVVVSADRLVEELWAGRPPATARASLQNCVSQLRKALGADVVVTRAAGYVLDVRPEQTDVGCFERLIADARAAATVEERAARLREGLALWRGPALADVTAGASLEVEAACLEELRVSALEEVIDAELELGCGAELVSELEQLIAKEPFRERPRAQLMLALYRAGRQRDALEAYQQARRMLVDELGLEPSGPLRELEQAILRQDAILDRATPAIPPAQSRKQVTILFADLVESEALAQRLDPEAFRELLDRYFAATRAAIERHGGMIEKFIGDAVMAVFGVPTAHEDDALRAVRAAVDTRAALAALNDQLEHEQGLRLQMRVGLNTGEVFVGDPARVSGLVTGGAVMLAKRLEEAAPPGEMLLAAETLTLVRDAVKATLVKSQRLREHAPIRAFQLLELIEGAPAIARYFDAPLIGRDAELAALRSAYGTACEQQRCQLVAVMGEPGVGKTRLARELAAELRDKATVLVGRCVAYGEGATFLPLREMVAQVGDLAAPLAVDQEAEMVARRVAELVGLAEGTSSLEEGLWAVRRLFAGLARHRPLILVFEDMHWAEPTLLSLVASLADVAAPILCLCIARPELHDEQPAWKTDALTLSPLAESEIHRLVAALPGGQALAAESRAQIVEAAGGNPLFAEQLLAHVQERGPQTAVAVPPSVQMLIASRLDLLEPAARAVLECAAVIGAEFSRAALQALSSAQSRLVLSSEIGALVRKGLVRPSRAAPGEELFRFHHVLVRDVAYAGLPKAERADLHEKLGDWLGEQPAAVDEIVGYHLEQALRYRLELGRLNGDSDLRMRAGTRLASAALSAFKRGDLRASSELNQRAAAVLPTRSHHRIEVLVDLPRGLGFLGETARVDEVMLEALRLAKASGDPRLEYHGLVTQALLNVSSRLSRPQRNDLIDVAKRALAVFQACGDEHGLAKTWRLLQLIHEHEGRVAEAMKAAERQVEHARRGRGPERPFLDAISLDAVRGPMAVADGLRLCEELLAEAAGNRFTEAGILHDKSLLTAMAGRLPEARTLLANAERIGQELALPGFVSARPTLELLADDAVAAERELRRQEPEWWGNFLLFGTALLAEALYRQGRYSEAEQFAAVARARADAHLDVAVQTRGVEAKLLARRGQTEAGEQLAREAVALSEPTDLLNLRGNTLLDLAEILRLDDRPREAASAVVDAGDLYDQKGNVISARKARALATELAGIGGARAHRA